MSDASTSPGRNPGNRTDNRGRGRAREPTDASRKQVEALASFGVPRGEIAKVAGICLNTLIRHYGDTLDIAATKANSLVAQSLFNRAVKGRRSGGDERGDLLAEGPGGLAGEGRARDHGSERRTDPDGRHERAFGCAARGAPAGALVARCSWGRLMMDANQETAWPADRVERRALASLVPYARNSRTHSAEQVDQIAASIREWGWTVPVLVDEQGGLIAGHARVMAAKQLGLAEVPVMVATGWSEAQKRAYVIADNKLALNAGWDDALLKIELTELQALDFDLGMTGFSLDEIATLTMDRAAGLTDPDDAPEAPADPVSRLGDVWLLGQHRLICGDATIAADVARALNGVTPALMVSDPPYGVAYDRSWRARAGVNLNPGKLGKVDNDDEADWSAAWALFPGDVAYVWHAGKFAATVQASLESCEFEVRSQIIWAKDRFALSRGDYHGSTNPAGTLCAGTLVAAGRATARNRRCGRSRREKTRGWVTARRSRWNACDGRSSTTRRPARPYTIPSSAPARQSSPAR